MIRRNRLSATCLVALFAWSCADAPMQPDASVVPFAPTLALTPADGVRISEIHYDNAGADAGEAIEIAGPAGTSLEGWALVLYNGNGGAVYGTRALSGTIPDQCSGMGTVVIYHTGIQNGDPDGIALVSPTGVVEFLSYGGAFVAVGGDAGGMMSTDIGVKESSSTQIGESLQRLSVDSWAWPAPNTFDRCNGGGGGGEDPEDPEEPGNGGGNGVAYISELQYDHVSYDTAEVIEISGVAGTSLTGWQVVLYNGNGGREYDARPLSGSIPTGCGVVLRYNDEIQNGPDGIALVDGTGAVVEFISYEGVFVATDGPAAGMTPTLMGVTQTGSTPVGRTLQRDSANGPWYAGSSTLTCGDGGGDDNGGGEHSDNVDPVFLSEIRLDALSGQPENEYFEVGGLPGMSLEGVSLVVLGGGLVEEELELSGATLGTSGTYVFADHEFTLGTADQLLDMEFLDSGNRTVLLVRNFSGDKGDDLDGNDDGELDRTPWTAVADCVSLIEYLGRGPVYCSARVFADGNFTPGHVTRGNDGWFSDTFTQSSTSDTPGAVEFDVSSAIAGVIAPWGRRPAGVPTRIMTNPSFVRVPEGFNRAIFVTRRDDYNTTVAGAVTFATSNPAVVTTDEFGNLTAVGVGEAELTVALASDPSVRAAVDVEVVADVPSGVAFQDHLEFGTPTDATPWDEHLIVRDEYALSYNAARGGPNWVAWNLDPSHSGSVSRCECYTPDPLRPTGAYGVVNFDYTGSGYSRGHVTQSANRNMTLPDNAATYYTSNILPMSSENNNGAWGRFESWTDSVMDARNAEVYIVAGGEYAANAPTLNENGRVAIPNWTWKVAVFMSRDATIADVHSHDDMEIVAIRTPNRGEPGVEGSAIGASTDWRNFVIEVDELEALIGYDVLSLLPDEIEAIVESGVDDLEDAYAGVEPSLRNEVANSLGQQLEQVAFHLGAGRTAQAIDRLETFLRLLDVFERNGKLDLATAAILRAEAERVIDVLE